MSTPLEAAIDAATTDPNVRRVMRLAAMLEGGNLTGPWGVGDNGQSFGPFQIYLAAHPEVTAAQAQDPTFAVGFMLPQFQAAVAQVDPARWGNDTMMASALAVFLAERPALMYPLDRVQTAWAALQSGGGGANPPETVGQGHAEADTTDPVTKAVRAAVDKVAAGIPGAIQAALGAVLAGFIAQAKAFWTRDRLIRIAVVIIGAVLLIEGLLFVAAPTITRGVEAVASA